MSSINFSSCFEKISAYFTPFYETVISIPGQCLAFIFRRSVTANVVDTAEKTNLEAPEVTIATAMENSLCKKVAAFFQRFCDCFATEQVNSSTISEEDTLTSSETEPTDLASASTEEKKDLLEERNVLQRDLDTGLNDEDSLTSNSFSIQSNELFSTPVKDKEDGKELLQTPFISYENQDQAIPSKVSFTPIRSNYGFASPMALINNFRSKEEAFNLVASQNLGIPTSSGSEQSSNDNEIQEVD